MGEEMTPSPVEMQSESDEAAPEFISTDPSGESSPKDTEDEIMPELPNYTELPESRVSKNEKLNTSAEVKKTRASKEPEPSQTVRQNDDDDEESKEVPLKQRLRSARNRKSDVPAGKHDKNIFSVYI